MTGKLAGKGAVERVGIGAIAAQQCLLHAVGIDQSRRGRLSDTDFPATAPAVPFRWDAHCQPALDLCAREQAQYPVPRPCGSSADPSRRCRRIISASGTHNSNISVPRMKKLWLTPQRSAMPPIRGGIMIEVSR